MRIEYVAAIAILGFSSGFLYADAQDIIFPGPAERPSRFPLNPNNGQRPEVPNNNNNGQRPQNPNNNNNGRWPQNPNSNNNGQFSQDPNNNNNGQQPNNPNGGVTQDQYNVCVDNCLFTSEYNPQCGSDGVTYQNPGALNCAINCGNPIQNLGRAPCTTTTTSSSSVGK